MSGSIYSESTWSHLEEIVAVRGRVELESHHQAWSQAVLYTCDESRLESKYLSNVGARLVHVEVVALSVLADVRLLRDELGHLECTGTADVRMNPRVAKCEIAAETQCSIPVVGALGVYVLLVRIAKGVRMPNWCGSPKKARTSFIKTYPLLERKPMKPIAISKGSSTI